MKLFTNVTKPFVLFVLLLTVGVGDVWADIDWSTYSWIDKNQGDETCLNKYKINSTSNPNPGNIQYKGPKLGIYMSFTSAISSCSLNSDDYAKEGAGMWVFLTALTAQETPVTVTCTDGSYDFTIYYADGTTGSGGSTTRTFKTGDRIYFKDDDVISGSTMKYDKDKLWAVFKGSSDETSNWIESQIQVGNWNEEGTIYYFDVPQYNDADFEYAYVIFTRDDWKIQTANLYPDESYNIFILNGYDGNKTVSGYWGRYSSNPIMLGSMNGWNPDSTRFQFGDYSGTICRLIVDLPADQTYDFKILHGTAYFSYDNSGSNNWYITNTTHDSWQTLYDNNTGNSHITTGEKGTYIFRYNDNSHAFAAYYPQARFVKNTILYFDVSDNTDWNNKTYTSKFYFKYWDSGSDISETPEIGNTPVENFKYYVTIPDNDWIGQVQVDRYDGEERKGATAISRAFDRSSTKQNCLKMAGGTSTATSWTTYCPPMTKPSISDNSPVTYGGNGESGTPFLIEKGTNITFTASGSSSTVNDANMEAWYEFKNNVASLQNDKLTTYTLETANTENNNYIISVDAYNKYKLDNTTTSNRTQSDAIYYKTVTCYSVTYDANNGTGSLPASSGSKYMAGTDVTLATNGGEDEGTLSREGYIFNGWNTASDGTGTNYAAGTTLSSIANNYTLYAQWIKLTNPTVLAATTNWAGENIDISLSATSAGIANPVVIFYVNDGTTTYEVTGTPYGNDGSSLGSIGGAGDNYSTVHKATFTATTYGTYSVTAKLFKGKLLANFDDFPFSGGKWEETGGTYNAHENNPEKDENNGSSFVLKITHGENWSNCPLYRFDTGISGYQYAHTRQYRREAGTTYLKLNDTKGELAKDDGFAANTWQKIVYDNGNYDVNFFYPLTKTGNTSIYLDDIILSNESSMTVQLTTSTISTTIRNEYTVRFENLGADVGHKGSLDTTVTFNDTINMKGKIEVPSKTHYDFGGYYTSANSGATLDVQLIDENGNWKKGVSGYTGTSEDNATWVYAGDITLYAKWTEHEYAVTLAISPAGAGTTSPASSTTAKYVTASGDITATANSGYSFREWGFSKVGEEDYDVYVSDGSTYSSTDATIRIKAQRDGTLTANFNANNYTVTLEDRGADEGHKGTPNVSVTYNAITNLTSAISTPEKTYYTFGGYYTSEDEGETLGTQLIDASGNWKKSVTGYTSASGDDATWVYAGNITLYAKWTETKHTVTVAVSPSSPFTTGSVTISGSEVTEVSVGKIIPTADMTAEPANAAFKFKEWQLSEHVSRDEARYTANANPNSFFAEDDGQITAVFQTRFGVIGSLKSSDAAGHGMPGWVWSNAVGFDVNGFTDFGEGEGKGVDFRYSTTLDPNTQYKFRLYDRIKDKAIGCAAEDVLPAEDGGGKYHNWQLNHTDDGQDILINTTGRGTYTFHITNISADGNFWPSIQVDRPTSYQLNLGWGYVETVDLTTVKSGNVGGTVTAVATEGGEENPITNGGWVVSGGTITFTPHPADDYVFAGWFTSSDYSSEFGDKLNPLPISSISGTVNVYAKFVEKSTTFEGDVVGHETEWNNTGNWSGGALPTINDIAIITKPVTVDIAHATAKSIVLDQNSNTGKLTIEANKGLEVVGTITRTTDGSNRLATREEDLVLESSSAGNASLIFNNSNSDAATVMMYSKATIVGSTWNWQYVGTPFTGSIPQYNYYGSWMYKWNGSWEVVHGSDELTPFAGYCLTQNSATTHVMGGTLVPTTSSGSISVSGDVVLANSWTAPIYIGGFTASTFTSTPATIYLFNTGMAENGSSEYDPEKDEAGTYIAVPINSAPYIGNGLIAPMQGFFVTTNGGSAGTITMNYDALVRPAGSHTEIVAGPMKMRKQEETKPDVMKIRANGTQYSDRVVILAREDFSEGFDNGWDGEKLSFGAEAPSVYVINQEGGYDAVSAIPSFEGTVVGFRAGTNNSCTMSFEYDGDETLYLNDLKEQQSTLISEENNYTFTTSAGDSEVRFIISATPIQKVPTGIGNDANDANDAMVKVRKLIINDHVYIIRSGRMYGVDGQMIK